jgi:hypothetical protein
MNRLLLSLCLFGAALATANTLLLQRSACPAVDNEMAALSSVRTIAPPKAQGSTPPRLEAHKATDKALAAASQDVTGSLRGDETTVPGPLDKVESKPSKTGNQIAEWAEVSIVAKVHTEPSVSAPIVRYYHVGTKLRVLERQADWTKIVDPVTSKQGWIYGKYLILKDGSSQPQADMRQPRTPSAQQRKRGWRSYGAQRPRFRIVFGVYPRW